MQCERAPKITRASGAATRRKFAPRSADGFRARADDRRSTARYRAGPRVCWSERRALPLTDPRHRAEAGGKNQSLFQARRRRGVRKNQFSLFLHVQDAEPLASNDSPPPERGSNHRRGPSEEKGSPVLFGPRQRHVARKRAASTPLAARQANQRQRHPGVGHSVFSST